MLRECCGYVAGHVFLKISVNLENIRFLKKHSLAIPVLCKPGPHLEWEDKALQIPNHSLLVSATRCTLLSSGCHQSPGVEHGADVMVQKGFRV